jgi:hypothetical protein
VPTQRRASRRPSPEGLKEGSVVVIEGIEDQAQAALGIGAGAGVDELPDGDGGDELGADRIAARNVVRDPQGRNVGALRLHRAESLRHRPAAPVKADDARCFAQIGDGIGRSRAAN